MVEGSRLQRATISWRIVAYIFMVVFAVITVFPILWLMYSSLKPLQEILQSPLALPKHPTFENYFTAWKSASLGIALSNSAIYTVVATVCSTFLALAASFGLAKFPFKSRTFFIGAFTLGLMITAHATIIPLFLAEAKIHVINTRLGVIIPYIAFDLPMSMLIALSYMQGIPNAIIESAEIDGAKYRYVFWQMIVPLSTPVITTMAILAFLGHWNEFLFVFVFTSSTAMKSLPVAITTFASKGGTEYGLQYAALVIGFLPMLIFYLAFHSQLIKGFGEGALKE
jgi:raffinose/stachyose/melibiose transport system permease protein